MFRLTCILRRKKSRTGFFFGIISVSVCFLLVSCGDPIGGRGKSPVFLSVRADDSYGVACDVYVSNIPGNVKRDTTKIVVKSIYRDPSKHTTSAFADILLQEQRVTYFRYDGNPNVPEPFVITLPGNLVPNGGELNLEMIVVRADAKLKSPLKELAFGGGEGEIYLSAQVEFYGEDLAGNSAYGKIVIPIWAKDY